MRRKYEGGCQCGAVRYVVDAQPAMIYACHCTGCQRQSSSAFGMTVMFAEGQIQTNGVEPSCWVREGRDGRKIRNYFCPTCGTRLYHQYFTDQGDMPWFNEKPGTLDDTSWLAPGCHMWTQHKQRWFKFSDDDVVFEQQPTLAQIPRFCPS